MPPERVQAGGREARAAGAEVVRGLLAKYETDCSGTLYGTGFIASELRAIAAALEID